MKLALYYPHWPLLVGASGSSPVLVEWEVPYYTRWCHPQQWGCHGVSSIHKVHHRHHWHHQASHPQSPETVLAGASHGQQPQRWVCMHNMTVHLWVVFPCLGMLDSDIAFEGEGAYARVIWGLFSSFFYIFEWLVVRLYCKHVHIGIHMKLISSSDTGQYLLLNVCIMLLHGCGCLTGKGYRFTVLDDCNP